MISFIDEHRSVLGVEPICRLLPIAPSKPIMRSSPSATTWTVYRPAPDATLP
jgi:hypothetical protein